VAIARGRDARSHKGERSDLLIATNNPHRGLELGLAAALVALTVTLYAPVRSFSFVNYDDNVYVSENQHIRGGLTSDNALWSLTAFENANWHPLTLLSHMLDVDLFGLDPSGHHVVNLVLHVLNVVLLFWLLSGTTSRPWPSAFVSALFAVHPLNVQTVAWISERKSLLSTAFWIAALPRLRRLPAEAPREPVWRARGARGDGDGSQAHGGDAAADRAPSGPIGLSARGFRMGRRAGASRGSSHRSSRSRSHAQRSRSWPKARGRRFSRSRCIRFPYGSETPSSPMRGTSSPRFGPRGSPCITRTR
jgi:hypothetical protein